MSGRAELFIPSVKSFLVAPSCFEDGSLGRPIVLYEYMIRDTQVQRQHNNQWMETVPFNATLMNAMNQAGIQGK